MPDKQANMEGPGNKAPVAEGTQPEQKDEDTPGGFGEQEADARPDDVPGDEVPGR